MEKTKKNGCCEDKYKLLQVEKNQKAESSYKLALPPVVAITTSFSEFQHIVPASVSEEQPVCNAPPRSRVPVHVRLCVFRI
jgi:hypothetical protein